MTTLDVSTDCGLITIVWNNSKFLEQYSICQNPNKFRILGVTPDFTFEKSLTWWNKEWNNLASLKLFDLDNNSKIIDIGSGIGILNLITYSYLKLQNKDSTYFLVDKEDTARAANDFIDAGSFCFYNNWEPFYNAVNTTNLDPESFKIIDPLQELPTNVDLIMSRRALCYHFSYNEYRERILNSLRIGGKLMLDVTEGHDDINVISEDMKSSPIYTNTWKTMSSVTTRMKTTTTCIWIKA